MRRADGRLWAPLLAAGLIAHGLEAGIEVARAQPPELYYEVDGAGPAIVFVPDWAEDSSVWFRVLPLLRDGHRLVRYDPRGQGRSAPPGDGDYSLEAHRDDLLRVMDGLGIGSAHVVAAGLGSRIALAGALAHPERFSTLTLIEPHLAWTNDEASFWGRLLQVWEEAGRPSLGRYAAVIVGDRFAETFMGGWERWIVDFYDHLLHRQDPDKLVASLRSWLSADLSLPEERNSVPVLIVRGGGHGGVEPLGDPRIRATFPYTRRVWVPQAGRSPQIEAPAELVDRIRERWAALEADSL